MKWTLVGPISYSQNHPVELKTRCFHGLCSRLCWEPGGRDRTRGTGLWGWENCFTPKDVAEEGLSQAGQPTPPAGSAEDWREEGLPLGLEGQGHGVHQVWGCPHGDKASSSWGLVECGTSFLCPSLPALHTRHTQRTAVEKQVALGPAGPLGKIHREVLVGRGLGAEGATWQTRRPQWDRESPRQRGQLLERTLLSSLNRGGGGRPVGVEHVRDGVVLDPWGVEGVCVQSPSWTLLETGLRPGKLQCGGPSRRPSWAQAGSPQATRQAGDTRVREQVSAL